MGLGGLRVVRAGVVGGSAERLWYHDLSLQREAEGEDKEVKEGGEGEGEGKREKCWGGLSTTC